MLLLQAEHVKIQSSPSVRRFCAIKLITMMTTSASSFALATLSLAWEGIKRCVTNVGASGLTNKKKHQLLQFNFIILWISNSIELHRLRVCAHTNIFYVFPDGGAANGRTVSSKPYVVRPMAVPYSQNIEPYVSSHERTGMYATR